MRTADIVYMDGPGTVTVRNEDLPQHPEAGQILCETIVSAISPGTELASYQGLPHLRPQVRYPRLQGYCNVARVVAVGGGVSRVMPGDRILSFTSHRSAMCISETDVLLVLQPEDNADAVVCAYLYHLGYNAMLRSNVRAGSQIVVIGLGTLGLTSVAMAALSGAICYTVSNQESGHRRASSLGAAGNFQRGDVDGLIEILGSRLADVVVVTTNDWDDWELALRLAGRFGMIACLGFPGRAEAIIPRNPLDSQYFYTKQLRIEAVGLSPGQPDTQGFLTFDERTNIAYLVQLIRQGRLDPSILVTGRLRGTDIDQAYRRLSDRTHDDVTLLLDWT